MYALYRALLKLVSYGLQQTDQYILYSTNEVLPLPICRHLKIFIFIQNKIWNYFKNIILGHFSEVLVF